ncbi:hypothetical protein QNJ28_08270 [Macrococcus caseolyticus]|uniref:hypothetical protein n=1 Tax=Macrococcoides caseolyticum TaxID=69966 RepID=UPI0024BC2C8E|nr:hypothetical protein [Macrococcus caseolyticus]MDJ1110092.1 hypothetical protein [Macrococcus caseolyticus]
MKTEEEYIINSFDKLVNQINEFCGEIQRERGRQAFKRHISERIEELPFFF